MLIEFKIANYRSIRAQQTLSFLASSGGELPGNRVEMNLPGMAGASLLKAAAIYGANASGKSNVLKALQFLVGFVRESASSKPDSLTGTQPFKLDADFAERPSEFELHAVIGGVRMLYGLSVTRQRVTSEYLIAYPKGRPQVWFERDWEGDGYKWSRSSDNFPHDEALRGKVRENASFISVAAQFAHVQARAFWDWCEQAFQFVPEGGDAKLIVELLSRPNLRAKVLNALVHADLGIVDASLESVRPSQELEEKLKVYYDHVGKALAAFHGDDSAGLLSQELSERQKAPVPKLLHRGKNAEAVAMNFSAEESEGTRRFLSILAHCCLNATGGRVMVIDELEASLHPILVREVLRFFTALECEGGTCPQLLFTTHNPLLLDRGVLRRDQIWFTEKDNDGATRLYPLTEFAPRSEEALMKGYLAGRYGGIPFLPQGLVEAK